MSDPAPAPCVLIVADPGRIAELAGALAPALPPGPIEVLTSSGGDDTIDLFDERKPSVVIVTASLELGDSGSLIEALRGKLPRGELAIVLVGDDAGPIRTALDAMELSPDRFVQRPVAAKALRFAVSSSLEAIGSVRARAAGRARTSTDRGPALVRPPARAARDGAGDSDERDAVSVEERGAGDSGERDAVSVEERGAGAADGPGTGAADERGANDSGERDAVAAEERGAGAAGGPGTGDTEQSGDAAAGGVTIAGVGPAEPVRPAPANDASAVPKAGRNGEAAEPPEDATQPVPVNRDAQRARWAALADSLEASEDLGGDDDYAEVELEVSEIEVPAEPPPLPPPLIIQPRRRSNSELRPPGWSPGTTTELRDPWSEETRPPVREPTLILRDEPPRSRPASSGPALAARGEDEHWSDPMPLVEMLERDSSRDLRAVQDELGGLDAFLANEVAERPAAAAATAPEALAEAPRDEQEPGRDFGRQLRAKMSRMAQRLFSNDAASSPAVDLRLRHDHQTEIDLASIEDEPALDAVVTEIERRTAEREPSTTPGSWDTPVRERGVPDAGEIVRGVTDAAQLLARMFAQGATGRVTFRAVWSEPGDERREIEKLVSFDQGRPVFATSNQPGDRMGALLVREGKITAAQYERCQSQVEASGRRMGEILVDFGYLKRRELLPAVRRHVEDIVYSLFGWQHGRYQIQIDPTPSTERIRLSRHPASLILEGVRRKLDRSTLERLLGGPGTVIEIADRDRLANAVHAADLGAEERAALAAFDGQADLTTVARGAGVDLADVLPIAWGLCVLGLATARRAEADEVDESAALVGETDLAIDRERVRARWRLVAESDYFALLGVRRDATAFEIRRAYQAARRDFAAEGFPGELRRELALELDEISAVLDEAFRVLRDDRLRQAYLANLVE